MFGGRIAEKSEEAVIDQFDWICCRRARVVSYSGSASAGCDNMLLVVVMFVVLRWSVRYAVLGLQCFRRTVVLAGER